MYLDTDVAVVSRFLCLKVFSNRGQDCGEGIHLIG